MGRQGLKSTSYRRPRSWAELAGGGFRQTTDGDVDVDVGAASRKDGDGVFGRREGASRAWGTLHRFRFRNRRPIRH